MNLNDEADALARQLIEHKVRVVLAESCTAGLASAALARTPGISEFHCGSAVTYRSETKVAWLRVTEQDLEQHTAVSDPVARQMAIGVLENTAEAEWSASITGHLGPDAPPELDGIVYVAVARRDGQSNRVVDVGRHQLDTSLRLERQEEAATLVLRQLREAITAAQ